MPDVLNYCVVTVTDRTAAVRYRWNDKREGSDLIDDDVSEWTDEEIREVVANIVGIEDDDREKIEVVWD